MHNSFALLDDEVIIGKALELGVDIASFPLHQVCVIKDLEIARHTLDKKRLASAEVSVEHSVGLKINFQKSEAFEVFGCSCSGL